MKGQIAHINQALKAYFEKPSSPDLVPAKDLMPEFVKAGVFAKDHKNGLPIRKLLRELDKSNQLNVIPFAHPVRKAKNTSWFFIRSSAQIPDFTPAPAKPTKRRESSRSREHSDEYYIIDLCDEVLGLKASRGHKFDFLLGDLHRNGKTRSELPCDAFYTELNLVIEFNEKQHKEAVSIFDKPDVKTVSGVNRKEQRALYDQRRREVLPEHGIRLIEIDYQNFEVKSEKKIRRNPERDIEVIRRILQSVL